MKHKQNLIKEAAQLVTIIVLTSVCTWLAIYIYDTHKAMGTKNIPKQIIIDFKECVLDLFNPPTKDTQ